MSLSTLKSRSFIAVVLTVVLVVGPLLNFQMPAAAEVPKLEQIRVAIFINSERYRLLEPVVTLSATGGLEAGMQGPTGKKSWISYPGAVTIRSSLDQYSVLMLETADFAAAKALNGRLSVMPGKSYMISRMKQGHTTYQVYYGSFSSADEAFAAGEQVTKDPAAASLLHGFMPQIAGPHYWNAGSYVTEAEASKQVGALSQTGLQAELVMQEDAAGKLIYSAWVGGVASPDQLHSVKQQTQKLLPNLVLQPAQTVNPYLIRKTDVTHGHTAAEAVAHYAVGGEQAKAWFQPKQGGVTVKERSDRTYRGKMEISLHNRSLALINELPLEQYLYAVVGSELAAGWPAEALKAQAVAARTYAMKQGLKYQIAQVTDTTLDQAYYGMGREFEAASAAVDITKGEVLVDHAGKLITPVYSSNAGGFTADPMEVWGNAQPYLRSVPSPDDGAAAGKAMWYQVKLANGKSGYVHSLYLKKTGRADAAGNEYYESTDSAVNVRHAPYVDNVGNPAISQLAAKQQVLVTGQQMESNAYSWVRMLSAAQLENSLAAAGVKLTQPLHTLEITKRGPSGRVVEMKANGQIITVNYPDSLRAALGGLPSTRFEIVPSGEYTKEDSSPVEESALGASEMIYVLGAGQSAPTAIAKSDVSVIGRSGTVHKLPQDIKPPSTAISSENGQFVFKGQGFGHGLGMSQWGARGYAELGYDYKKILQTYYYGVNITKE